MKSAGIKVTLFFMLMAQGTAFGSAVPAAAAGAGALEKPFIKAINDGNISMVEKYLADATPDELKEASRAAQAACKANPENPFRKQILKDIIEKQLGKPIKEKVADFQLAVTASAEQPQLNEAQRLALAIANKAKQNALKASLDKLETEGSVYIKGLNLTKVQLAQQLVQRKFNLSQRIGKKGRTLAMRAAYKNDIDILNLVIPQMSAKQMRMQDADGENLLTFACQYCDTETVARLLSFAEVRAIINEKNAQGNAALHCTVKDNIFPETEILLNFGADANTQRKDGWTPLMVSVYTNEPELTKLLLRHQANAALTVDDTITALGLAQTAVENSIFDDEDSEKEKIKVRNNAHIITLLTDEKAKAERESKKNLAQLLRDSDKKEVARLVGAKDALTHQYNQAQRVIDTAKPRYAHLIMLCSGYRKWPTVRTAIGLDPAHAHTNTIMHIIGNFSGECAQEISREQFLEFTKQKNAVLKTLADSCKTKKKLTAELEELSTALQRQPKPKNKKK